MPAPLMAGAEPRSFPGGPHGALVLHGYTGTPGEMRGLAGALATAGFAVEAPLLPGHGTCLDDLVGTGWPEWSAAAEEAYEELAGRCERVVVAGLSMGGTLGAWLAARRPQVAGLVCVNPFLEVAAGSFLDLLGSLLDEGITALPAGGSDIARPGVSAVSYDAMPVAPLVTLFRAIAELVPELSRIACPVLLLTSREDHVAPATSSELLAARVGGPVERVTLERSFHVATLDWDAAEVERRTVAFATTVTAGRLT